MDTAAETKRHLFYAQAAIIVFALIVAAIGRGIVSYVLLLVFGSIAISYAAHLIAVWLANAVHYGPREMFLRSKILRQHRNAKNNKVMAALSIWARFALGLAVVGLFLFPYIFVAIPVCVVVFAFWLRTGIPPFALMLGATRSGSYTLSRRIMAMIAPLTVIELLDSDAVGTETKYRSQDELGRFGQDVIAIDSVFLSARTDGGGDSWQEAVAMYCLLARVIVFDFVKRSAHTDFEIQFINEHKLWYKVVIIGDGDNWLWRQPWYAEDVLGVANIIHYDSSLAAMLLGQIVAADRMFDAQHPIGAFRLKI
jgi:hypothetical protein